MVYFGLEALRQLLVEITLAFLSTRICTAGFLEWDNIAISSLESLKSQNLNPVPWSQVHVSEIENIFNSPLDLHI